MSGTLHVARKVLRSGRGLAAELAHDLRHQGRSPNFHRVARVAHGMLSPRIYEALYRRALGTPAGDFLDVGTGRGASAIALGLAIEQGAAARRVFCVDQFHQHEARRPHRYTLRSHGERAVELNVAIFRANLQRFGVLGHVEVLVGRTTEVAERLPEETNASLLFLDVDGCIDRDLGLFYHRLCPGAAIVVDDYGEEIDDHGRRNLEHYAGLPASERRAFLAERDDFARGRLLGKHVLTTRLVDHFQAAGLLERERVIESTFFGRIPPDAPAGRVAFDEAALGDLRAGILAEFVRRAGSGRE